MKILAFLQNQWFPASKHKIIKYAYSKHGDTPEDRADLNARYLFFGCLTGKRLRAAFGDLCDDIIWENASPEIGSESCAKFPPDPQHIAKVILHFRPQVVLTFGSVASQGVLASLKMICPNSEPVRFKVIGCPHPAARHATALNELRTVAEEIGQLMAASREVA